jgi:hypothetical protein
MVQWEFLARFKKTVRTVGYDPAAADRSL